MPLIQYICLNFSPLLCLFRVFFTHFHWSTAWSVKSYSLILVLAICSPGCSYFDVLLFQDSTHPSPSQSSTSHTNNKARTPTTHLTWSWPHLQGSDQVLCSPSFLHPHGASQGSSFVLRTRCKEVFVRWGWGSRHKRHRCRIKKDADAEAQVLCFSKIKYRFFSLSCHVYRYCWAF